MTGRGFEASQQGARASGTAAGQAHKTRQNSCVCMPSARSAAPARGGRPLFPAYLGRPRPIVYEGRLGPLRGPVQVGGNAVPRSPSPQTPRPLGAWGLIDCGINRRHRLLLLGYRPKPRACSTKVLGDTSSAPNARSRAGPAAMDSYSVRASALVPGVAWGERHAARRGLDGAPLRRARARIGARVLRAAPPMQQEGEGGRRSARFPPC